LSNEVTSSLLIDILTNVSFDKKALIYSLWMGTSHNRRTTEEILGLNNNNDKSVNGDDIC